LSDGTTFHGSESTAAPLGVATSLGLAVFDLDGTLLPGTTACQQIALAAGESATVERLERDYRTGLVSTREFAEQALRSWTHAGEDLYRRAYESAPKIGGLEQTLRVLRSQSVTTCLVTMAPGPFAKLFTDFDHVYASTYPSDILEPEDKPRIVQELMHRLGLDDAQTIAFGDADSDLPLFRTLTRTVAVNANPQLASLASRRYDGDDLLAALRLVSGDGARTPGAGSTP
jgi:phosphoserine phosphatase